MKTANLEAKKRKRPHLQEKGELWRRSQYPETYHIKITEESII
jgi:hypothetical protein